MIVGVAECECMIYDAHSLKEKRAVLQRILTRLKQKFNVSVAEVDLSGCMAANENCHRCCLFLKGHRRNRELQNAIKFIDSFPEIERTITEIEWL